MEFRYSRATLQVNFVASSLIRDPLNTCGPIHNTSLQSFALCDEILQIFEAKGVVQYF